jgi:hypothetical protein
MKVKKILLEDYYSLFSDPKSIEKIDSDPNLRDTIRKDEVNLDIIKIATVTKDAKALVRMAQLTNDARQRQ